MQGNPYGQLNLGVHYATGRAVAKDDSLAREWYLKSALQGNATAQANLGVLHMDGRGGPVDLDEAEKWFTRAAKSGNSNGHVDLGILNLRMAAASANEAAARDALRQAVEWFEQGVKLGNADAEARLGSLLCAGLGVPVDGQRGLALLRSASEKGNALAKSMLLLIENGRPPGLRDLVVA